MKHVADAKHEVLTLVKIKHRSPETRISPCLIYLSRLEKMHVEFTAKNWMHMTGMDRGFDEAGGVFPK